MAFAENEPIALRSARRGRVEPEYAEEQSRQNVGHREVAADVPEVRASNHFDDIAPDAGGFAAKPLCALRGVQPLR